VVRVARYRHLVRRFVGVLTARPAPDDAALLDRYLSPAERALFATMQLADRRHSLDLCARLLRDGHADPDLLRAALLHDVGKAAGPIPLPHRVVYSFCAVALPSLAAWLARGNPTAWRRPFHLAARHPEVGARAAWAAGSSETVVRLIQGHESPGSDELSRILYRYDGEM
jgi:hypothetical protein